MDVGEIQADAKHWEMDAEKLRLVKRKQKIRRGRTEPFQIVAGKFFFIRDDFTQHRMPPLQIQVSTRDLGLPFWSHYWKTVFIY